MKSLKSDNEFLLFHSLFSFSKKSVKATYFLNTYTMWKSTLKRDHEFCEKIKVFTSNQSKITEMFYLLSTTLKNSQNSIPPPFFTKWITVHSVTHCGKTRNYDYSNYNLCGSFFLFFRQNNPLVPFTKPFGDILGELSHSLGS